MAKSPPHPPGRLRHAAQALLRLPARPPASASQRPASACACRSAGAARSASSPRTRRIERAAARAPEVRRRRARHDAALGRRDLQPAAALGRRLLPPPARRRAVRRDAENAARRARLPCAIRSSRRLGDAGRAAIAAGTAPRPPAAERSLRSSAPTARARGDRGSRATRPSSAISQSAAGSNPRRGPRRRRRHGLGRPGPVLTADQARGGDAIGASLEVRSLPAAWRHRQRQDGGVPAAHRARARSGPRRARARARDRADAAARRALSRTTLGAGRRVCTPRSPTARASRPGAPRPRRARRS